VHNVVTDGGPWNRGMWSCGIRLVLPTQMFSVNIHQILKENCGLHQIFHTWLKQCGQES